MNQRDRASRSTQQTARVNLGSGDWIEFRTLAMRARRSIADYLGELVRKELERQRRRDRTPPPAESRETSSQTGKPPVRLGEQEVLTGLPGLRPEES